MYQTEMNLAETACGRRKGGYVTGTGPLQDRAERNVVYGALLMGEKIVTQSVKHKHVPEHKLSHVLCIYISPEVRLKNI
jgi:hypothetical protein